MFYFKLYMRFLTQYFKSMLEYRIAFLLDFLVNMIIFGSTFFSIWVIATKFHNINGWNLYEIMFLYNISVLSYGVAGIIMWKGMQSMDWMIIRGEFDTYLTKPINPLVHLAFRNVAHQFVGNFFICIIMFTICFQHLAIRITLFKIIWLVVFVLSSSLIQMSMMILISAASFFMKQTLGLRRITFLGVKNFVDYPLSIYPEGIQFLLTFIIPFGFVNYYPAQYFLNRVGGGMFSPILQYLSPLVACVFFGLAVFAWKMGVKRYESSGN